MQFLSPREQNIKLRGACNQGVILEQTQKEWHIFPHPFISSMHPSILLQNSPFFLLFPTSVNIACPTFLIFFIDMNNIGILQAAEYFPGRKTTPYLPSKWVLNDQLENFLLKQCILSKSDAMLIETNTNTTDTRGSTPKNYF